MTILRITAFALVALLAAGCQSVAERRAADEEKCLSYGFRQGTTAFAECLQRIDLNRSANVRSMRYYDTHLAFGHEPRVYVVRERERRRDTHRPRDCKVRPCR
ncbi:hypothetical protein [Shinella daejeonensis]|uniref:hypothetical protein n=1 Tax=Shinella daejeonensis TaxID=659017 RepID=UPI0020C7C203|nr:hypothetical protein [Shinella daejeonensis]